MVDMSFNRSVCRIGHPDQYNGTPPGLTETWKTWKHHIRLVLSITHTIYIYIPAHILTDQGGSAYDILYCL